MALVVHQKDGSVVPHPLPIPEPTVSHHLDFTRLVSHEIEGSRKAGKAQHPSKADPSRPFDLVAEIEANPKAYIAGETGACLTLKVFPLACWNTLDTLQGRVRGGIGKAPMVSACLDYGIKRLGSLESVQEYIKLKKQNRDARPDLDTSVKNQLTQFLEGFTVACNLSRKSNGWRTSVPVEIHNTLKAFSESTGIEKAPLAVWCIAEALVIQPREINGGVGVNDGHRKEMQGYLSQVAHDLEIATRWARAGMKEFDV